MGLWTLLESTLWRTSATCYVKKGTKPASCSHLNGSLKTPLKSHRWALWNNKHCWRERTYPLKTRSKQIQKELSRYSRGRICQHFLSFYHLIHFQGLVREIWNATSSVLTTLCYPKIQPSAERKGSEGAENLLFFRLSAMCFANGFCPTFFASKLVKWITFPLLCNKLS